ncbi:hypothetical protein BH20ACT24_BH20ACT24_03810 [soil metagenome]
MSSPKRGTKSPGTRPRTASTRRPQARRRPSFLRRYAPWLLVLSGLAIAGLVTIVVSTRGGTDSTPDRPFVGGDLHSLVVDPTDGGRLYVGGHEGVATSANGGRTWRQIETLEAADAMGWAFTEDLVLVGGHPGLRVSRDGGATFELQNETLPATDIHALGAGADVIYAASPQVGVFVSTDAGGSWTIRTTQVGHGFMGRILVDPEDSEHILAPDMQNGAVESLDGGRTWRALGGVPGAMWVSWDPRNTNHVMASNTGSAATTTDGGVTWRAVNVPPGASLVEISPEHPEVILAAGLEGTSARVWMSRDEGATWTAPS